jgi:hypothetical protein
MPSIADTATQLAAAGVPVLFLDTCSILDVIRAPVRGLGGCIEAASELLTMVTASPVLCNLVVGSFVPEEWNSNNQAVLAALSAHFDEMDQQAKHYHELCAHFGIPLSFSKPQYAASSLVSRVHDLSRRLLQVAVVIDPHPATQSRAYARVAVTRRRPCRKGGELKDCTILEEFLELCQQLQAVSFPQKKVFCSSNTVDYCAPGATPHPEIDADCAAVGLQFTTNLPWAVSELKK